MSDGQPGRPEFAVNTKMRVEVIEMVALGTTEADICRVIGCSVQTLRKHFEEELLTGRAKKRREIQKLLFANARKGNVTAQKYLDHVVSMSVDPIRSARPAMEDKPAERLGKKEEAAAAAQEPPPEGSKWAGLIH